MEKLLEERGEQKTESRVELFLGKTYGIILRLVSRNSITLQQLNGHSVWDTQAFPEFPLAQKLSVFSPSA